MAKKQLQFEERLQQLARKHRDSSSSSSAQLQSGGLRNARPKRRQARIPFRAIIMFFAAFVGFKAFLLAEIGSQTYDARVVRLQSGTAVERAGAYFMQADPLAVYVANQIGPILR